MRRSLVACVLIAVLPLRATDYYLGPAAGSQPGVRVESIGALNALRLQAGDRVLFQGGQTFAGNIVVDAQDAGTRDRPVTFSSFGSGRATIAAGQGTAIQIENAGGMVVRNLNLTGAGADTNSGSGIDAGVYLPGTTELDYLRFEQLTVTGFGTGVQIWGWHSTPTLAWPGFRDVVLRDAEVRDVRSDGISVWGTWAAGQNDGNYSHRDVTIARCVVSGARGDPAATAQTGSGIVLGCVDRGVVEYSVAHDNGGRGSRSGGGPFGIWVWESNAITIQHNLVYNQKSSSDVDGGGFDLDGGASNCVVQYNYSYDNEGPGFALIQFDGASPIANNVVRYNISENDARKATSLGAIYVGDWAEPGRIDGSEIFGNTVHVAATATGARPPAVMVERTGEIANVRLRNNLFHATHDGPLLGGSTERSDRVLYQGNSYWGGAVDLAVLRSHGHETVNGRATGLRLEPRLRAAGQGGAITSTSALGGIDAYRLRADSPLIGAGLDLAALFGVDPGPRDFFGQRLPAGAPSIGADAVGAASTPSGPPVTGTLLNLSARARSGTGDDVLIAGWAVEGDASLLVRGVGPGLQPYGVTGWLADPRLTLYDRDSAEIGSNDDWGNGGAGDAIRAANTATGAFGLATRDAAVTRKFTGGTWSAIVRGDAAGVALVEIYRMPAADRGRLVNLSARAYAGSGSETLIAGFVVGGNGARVLLRGLGPMLERYGVTGVLADPVLRVFSGDREIGSNDNWGEGDAAAVRATGFAPPEESRDAALVVTLAPGNYTAHVESANGRAGVALVEVYLLP